MNSNNKKYLRQSILPEISDLGQQRISKSRILCVGVGGLGSPAALYLAAAGVGQLGIIDFDQVDQTNLHRQILFSDADTGRPKIQAAKERLERQNPDIKIHAHPGPINEKNAIEIFSQYDLIIEGSDNFSTKLLVNDAAYCLGLPIVFGAVNRFEGQVALFWAKRGPCYRCYVPERPKAQIQNCAEAGVLGPVVGIVGSMQATLALQFIISNAETEHPLCPSFSQLTLLDFQGAWMMRTLSLPKNPHCSTCGIPASAIKLSALDISCVPIKAIQQQKLSELISNNNSSSSEFQLIDVREIHEWNEGHLPHAIHIPLSELEKHGPNVKLSKNKMTILYCKAGMRSKRAAELFIQHGFENIEHLSGGIDQWRGPLKRSTSKLT